MRHILPLTAVAFLLAGCAARTPEPTAPVSQAPATPAPQTSGNLLGLTSGELIQRMGQPALQVREGPGLKLQFRGRSCVLDAYLYPTPSGGLPERVTHVDTRLQNGNDTSQAPCIASLTRS
jgi:hypothetical protein